ncbi:MAG TPA: RagB/SusD family nutrient uptake outer membrane protein, partial [Puia sp.]
AKIAFVILVAAGLFQITSCNKQLTTKVYSQLTPQNFYQSDADAFAALVTIYVPFTSYWGNVDPGNGTWYAGLYNADIKTYLSKSLIGTDEIYNVGTDVNTSNLFNFTWGPSTWTLSSGNEANYDKVSYVAKATEVINDISNSTNISAASKTLYTSEAKALRAWLMFVLYDFYGPLNVKTDPATLTDTAQTSRWSSTDYINQMVKDLNDALPNLPVSYNGDAANWGRMSQGVVNMLLLKIYMRTKQWANAQAAATAIMNMNQYGLLTGANGYLNVFTQSANKEIIYAVPANAASPNFWAQEVFPQDFASAPDAYVPITPRAVGWLTQYMPWSFYDLYEAGDIRKNTTILDHYTNNSNVVKNRANGMPGAIPLKYTSFPQGNIPGQGVDVVVFRYSEVLLSLAEAINEQGGPNATAYSSVNAVRERAGLADWSGMTQSQFRDSLLNERGREFYAEGVRRQDLIRHGSYISNAIARGKNAHDYDTLFPIPNSVIVAGRGVIAQNPGY